MCRIPDVGVQDIEVKVRSKPKPVLNTEVSDCEHFSADYPDVFGVETW